MDWNLIIGGVVVCLVALNSLPLLWPTAKSIAAKVTGRAVTARSTAPVTAGSDTSHPYAVLDQLDGVLKGWGVPGPERKALLTPIHEALWGKVQA